MKRIPTQKNSFLKRLLINIPFVLLVALMIACFGGGAFCVMYCFITAAAFHSAMISLILLGAGALLIGLGLLLIVGFKRYYAFYDRKMGWQYPDRVDDASQEKTAVGSSRKPLKEIFSLQNVAIGALALGAVFTVISAALGCIDRANWVAAISPYREAHGYYGDVIRVLREYYVENINTHKSDVSEIDISLIEKQAVIVYTDEETRRGKIMIEAYISYENQVTFSLGKNGVLSIEERPEPENPETALDKLLFFADDLLRSYPSERQIIVYIPENFRDDIEIVGEHIVAKRPSADDDER